MNSRKITTAALLAAIICILSPVTIPLAPVPITLATLAVYFVSAVVGWQYGLVSVVVYIALGCLGLPVFSGFSGGLQKLAGPTGGYIIGYLPCALVIGFMVGRQPQRKWIYPVSMVLGTLACYLCGITWFILQTKMALPAALAACVLPFLPGDAIKIVCASILAFRLRPRIGRFCSAG